MKYFILLFIFYIISSPELFTKEQNNVTSDAKISDTLNTDTIVAVAKNDYLTLTKSPTGAILRSLAMPGWGQIYVNDYWKSTIFIGAAGFLWYRIISNHLDYKHYKNQLDKLENQSSFEYRILQGQMINAVDNRDISSLYLLGVYILSMVDAYSGAHLFDFKINSNLSYSVSPNLDLFGNPSISIQIKMRNKEKK